MNAAPGYGGAHLFNPMGLRLKNIASVNQVNMRWALFMG
jgi:hypothetical protein